MIRAREHRRLAALIVTVGLGVPLVAPTQRLAAQVTFTTFTETFEGGTLVPDPAPPGTILPLPTGPAGTIALDGSWPAGIPSGFTIFAQCWVEDPAGPAGFAASNALRGTAP